MSRTTDAAEYYVAGRRVPAIYNGMATGADWMSAASFIGMAGTLYLTGYGGLAFIMGWTGGYCLVALFLAPYLRKFGQFTIPDFLGARYEGNLPRFIGIVAAILCSFTYVVAQIYGVGIITARLTGLAFEIGIFVGLGGILVCSFLGGMRAVTWTQVAQYIILIIAYLDAGGLAVGEADERAGAAGDLRPAAPEGHRAGAEADRRPEGEGSHRHLQAAFRCTRREAEGRADRARRGQGRGREEAGRPEGRQCAGGRDPGRREGRSPAMPKDEAAAKDAWTKAKAAADASAKPLAGMPRHAQRVRGRPQRRRRRRRRPSTSRAATSWRWCSA